MSRTVIDHVQNGLWTTWYDYDRSFLSRHQILVTSSTSQYITNWIAVLLSLSIPCAYVVLRRILLTCIPPLWNGICWASGKPLWRQDAQPQDDLSDTWGTDEMPLLVQFQKTGDEDNPLKAIQKVVTNINGEEGGIVLDDGPPDFGPAVRKSLENAASALKAMWQDFYLLFAVVVIILFFSSLFVGGTYLSVISADIANDSVVSSSSPLAGQWESDTTSAAFLLGGGAVVAEDRQARTWDYKTACYDTEEGNPACNMLYRQNIPFKTYSNTPCPFDGDACLLGSQSGFTVTTHLVDSNVLGINAEPSKRFFFERNLTCSPLHMDERYIRTSGGPEYPNEYRYNYGPVVFGPYIIDNDTYLNSREWMLKADSADVQDYKVSPVIYNPVRGVNTFDALPEFRSGNKTVTILFITTGGDYHLHVFQRDDPIFPATTKVDLQIGLGTDSTFWMNNSTRAGVLGCVDSYRVCGDTHGSQCWDISNVTDALDHFAHDQIRQRALYLTLVALNDSNVWNILDYKGAEVLNATAEISRLIGIRLAKKQWKVEVSNIFKAILAAIQIRAFDFARGTYAKYPGMIDKTPELFGVGHSGTRPAVQIAEMYKFRSSAYQNVSAVGFWGINALCIALFLGTRRFSTAENRRKAKRATNGHGGFHDNLWVTIACKAIVLYFPPWLWTQVRQRRKGKGKGKPNPGAVPAQIAPQQQSNGQARQSPLHQQPPQDSDIYVVGSPSASVTTSRRRSPTTSIAQPPNNQPTSPVESESVPSSPPADAANIV